MAKARRATLLPAVLLLAGGAAWLLLRDPERPPVAARLSVATVLEASSEAGFARALAPRGFVFPADHGPHPGFRTEWWYFTGNLEAAGGRRFGYQLTFFRNALAPGAVARASRWGAREAWLAHFALTDVAGRRFHAFERFRRGALRLAGAETAPFRVWLDRWEASGAMDSTAAAAAWGPLTLRAAEGEVALDLRLARGKPPVLQGEAGLSRKGAAPGQASYYYSLTRMPTTGRLRLAGEDLPVRGLSWMDREWSTSSLSPGQVGWDWFALQLADGRELMLYRMRLEDGGIDPASAGSLVAADGAKRHLARGDFAVAELARWRSPAGASYPARWRVRVPSAALDLEVRPLVADQEHRGVFRYWEGAVAVRGTAGGVPIGGRGYVELTGYTDREKEIR